jgi:hypothetical protein
VSSLEAVSAIVRRCDRFERELDARETGRHANELARHYLRLALEALLRLDEDMRPDPRRRRSLGSLVRNAHRG